MSNAILEAANRIMHQDYPDGLTQEQRVEALDRDANLLAGDYLLMWRDLADTTELLTRVLPWIPLADREEADARIQANQRRLGLAAPEGDK